MEHHHPIVLEQASNLGEELVIMIDADVLEHAHRDDAVELLGDVAIILQSKLDSVGKSRLARPLGRDGELLLG
jgi:hypothetical protein